ncbi:MAG TPA: thioester reductase domain-containing protein, partial [Candidatus Dormibacteraeota bacterium]|nr:thioester reductase domain-containing protein [Candidatus Dormibacteraeota bacterium]
VNTLVLRLDGSGRPTVGEMLQRVKAQVIAAQQHQDIPFEQVVELVQPVRSLAHSPLFQAVFAWQDAQRNEPELRGLEIGPLSRPSTADDESEGRGDERFCSEQLSSHTISKFDLTLALQESEGRIAGAVEYATALFEGETVERYLDYFTRLLEGVVAGGDSQALEEIAILGEQERQQVVHEWSKREIELPTGICADDLFEANLRIYVLDEQQKQVPIGVVGELYIGGTEEGRRSLDRRENTAKCFFKNSFVEDSEALMYRTGKLARWRRDGSIEFLGEKDDLVKIRGHRIELGKIEAQLNERPDVLESVVLARKEAGGEQRLVAYYAAGEEVEAENLRGYLSEKLPEYMVPAAYVRMEKLPRTASGEVDREALSSPEEEEAFAVVAYEAPEGEIEAIVAGIWADVLKVERVGRRDSFFALGGRSLLAVQVTARLRQQLSVEVGVEALFAQPVFRDFARVVETAKLPVTMRADHGEQLPTLMHDLAAEAVLDASIVPMSQTPVVMRAENIFLTGASGFLGCFLLADFLKHTQATVYCLVRSTTTEEGMARLSAKLKSFGLWDAAASARIVAVPGDLSKPLLGLSFEQFETMANVVDAVYHSAALVNAVYSYDLMKSANVLGTQEIIRMACLGRRKVLHHISTLSVFPALLHSGEAGPVDEETLLDRWQELPFGYGQSKWVAEKLVQMAGSRGLAFAIYRPCYISGSLQSGAGNADDFLSLFITACLQLGCVPDTSAETNDSKTGINMLPVDYMSRAILRLSQRAEVLGRSINLMHEKSISFGDIVDSLTSWGKTSGCPMEKVPFESWRSRCHATEELKALQIFFPESTHQPIPRNTNSPVELAMDSETSYLLQAEGIPRPPITLEVLERYISYLGKHVSNGLLAATG